MSRPFARIGRRTEKSIFPLVSVCFAYNVREKGAAATLASLKQQDYPHLEIVVAECGSEGSPPSKSSRDADRLGDHELRTIYQRSSEIGAGRNAAVRAAKGEYLFFVDDHSLLLAPNALSIFVQVAQRVDADIFDFSSQLFLSGRRTLVGESPRALPPPVSRRRCRYWCFHQLLREHQRSGAARRVRRNRRIQRRSGVNPR